MQAKHVWLLSLPCSTCQLYSEAPKQRILLGLVAKNILLGLLLLLWLLLCETPPVQRNFIQCIFCLCLLFLSLSVVFEWSVQKANPVHCDGDMSHYTYSYQVHEIVWTDVKVIC